MRKNWGEFTGVYESKSEAKRLWDFDRPDDKVIYVNPRKSIKDNAVEQLERKLKRYGELVEIYGPGHLLMSIHSPPGSTRETRIAVENAIVARLSLFEFDTECPFQSIWLGCRYPKSWENRKEDLEDVFYDPEGTRALIFLKCIWDRTKILQ